jgi:hypothetical protein
MDEPRRDYGPAGCAERSASIALVGIALVAALAGGHNGSVPAVPAPTAEVTR